MGFAQTAALGGMSTCTDESAQSCSGRFFPQYFVETPAMKSSEGRHYRKFSQEGEVQFGRQFPLNCVTFWSPLVLLATFGDTLGAGPHVLTFFGGFWTHLGASGRALEHHGDPIGRHCATQGIIFYVFLTTSVRNPVFHHFGVAKTGKKQCISREADVFKI